ncbi:hypothetical protein GCM10010232_59440 [Streptomyces amakusaensis]|uniref:Uncharacterized protein n=1 Tax=Streptomyces amakusaensis TaxID=67271 RepID=A0ABW0AT42_9ACTN
MSGALVIPTVEQVMAQVDFPVSPLAESGIVDAGTGTGTVSDAVSGAVSDAVADPTVSGAFPRLSVPDVIPDFSLADAGGEVLDSALDQAQELLLPALIGLGSLSGALLAGRAAMAGAQLLAASAVRAAESQAALRKELLTAAQAAECWREAVFAAARTNARLAALRARIRRAGPPSGSGPGGPPDLPDLPPPLDPVGMRLTEVWRRLAETGTALRRAETAFARATMEAADGAAFESGDSGDGSDSGWHTRLRARRRQALTEYERTGRTGAGKAAGEVSVPPAAEALSEEEVLRLGGELLARLPRDLPSADYRLLEEMITAAAGVVTARPAAARRHLREAGRFAERMTRAAERLRADEEWAAQQLDFLRRTPPDGTVRLPVADGEIAALERVLSQGEPLADTVRTRVAARVGERTELLQRLYTAEVIRAAAREASGDPAAGRPADSGTAGTDGTTTVDWTPPGWGDTHWLRLLVNGGAARVVTMHRERSPGEETDADRDLDWRRCTEAAGQLAALERLTERAGLPLRLTFDPVPERPAPREPAVADEDRRSRDRRTGPRARHHDRPDRPGQEPRR